MSIVPAGRAAVGNLNAEAAWHQQAIDELAGIGTPNAQNVAQMIADNPQAAHYMIEQQGGWAQFAQQEQAQAAFGRASEMAAQGATPGQVMTGLGQQGDVPPDIAAFLAKTQYDLNAVQNQTKGQIRVVADGNSPTGYAYESYDPQTMQALGRAPGAPAPGGGQTIKFDENGRIVSIGPGRDGGDLTKKTTGNLQESIIHTGERLRRLDAMIEKYNPEFLTYGRQGLNWVDRTLDKMVPGNQARQDRIDKYQTFAKRVNEDLVPELRAMAGAAMTDVEIELLTRNLPTLEQSPQEFETQVREIVRTAREKILYESFVLRRGLDWVSSGDAAYSPDLGMGKLKRMRGDRFTEIQGELADRFPTMPDEEVDTKALEQLNSETQSGGLAW